MYGVLHVDNEAHTVDLIPLKELDNIPVFVEPLNPYELHGVRVFDSSSFRMVLCFFDRFYVTVGDIHVLEFDSPQAYMEHMRVSLYDAVLFSPVVDGRETNPWRMIQSDTDGAWVCEFAPVEEGLSPSRGSTLWSTSGFTAVGQWGTNNFSAGEWRLVDARRPHSTQRTI